MIGRPIRESCDVCSKPLGEKGWTEWRLSIDEPIRVAHTSCFEEMESAERNRPTNTIETNG